MAQQPTDMGEFAAVEIAAHGDRRDLEAWLLEVKQLAKQRGFDIEFSLSKEKPGTQAA